jgi:hypothetical protein
VDNLSPKFWWRPLDGMDKVFEQMTAIELHGIALQVKFPNVDIDAKGCFFRVSTRLA